MVKNPSTRQETQEKWVQSLVAKISRRRKWQLTPVFLPGKFQGQRTLVGYSPWHHKELHMIEHARMYIYHHFGDMNDFLPIRLIFPLRKMLLVEVD